MQGATPLLPTPLLPTPLLPTPLLPPPLLPPPLLPTPLLPPPSLPGSPSYLDLSSDLKKIRRVQIQFGVVCSSPSDGIPWEPRSFVGCPALVAKRRCECSRGFQPPVQLAMNLASRQRRGDRGVRGSPSASPLLPICHPVATRRRFPVDPVRGLKPPATFIPSLRDERL